MKHALSLVILIALLTSLRSVVKADTDSVFATDVTQSSSTDEITSQPKTPEANTNTKVEDNTTKPEPIKIFGFYLAATIIIIIMLLSIFDHFLIGICLGLLLTNILALIVSPFIWVIYDEIKLGLAMAIAGIIGISIGAIGLYFIEKAES